MKTFKGELPEVVYHVRARNPEKFAKFLAAYGCKARAFTGNDFFILCGGEYHYRSKSFYLDTPPTITPRQFKRLVREAVGEPE